MEHTPLGIDDDIEIVIDFLAVLLSRVKATKKNRTRESHLSSPPVTLRDLLNAM